MLTKILILVFSLLVFLSWTAAQAAPAPALQPLTLILDWFVNPDHAPMFVAQQQGFFKQQGLDVTFISPADPSDPPKLVAAGKADLAITYQPQLILQVEQGLPLVQIATLIADPLNCLAVNENGPIHSLADLKGKRVGYTTGGIDDAVLSVMLKQQGLTLNDIQLTNVHYGLTQALLAHRVDAVIGVMRNFEIIEMALAGHPAREFDVEKYGVPPYDELIIVTNPAKLHDPRLPRFLTALTQGAQYLSQHPEATWLVFAKQHPELNNELNHRAWMATLPHFSLHPAVINKERYPSVALFLQKAGLIKTILPTNRYAH